MDFGGRRHVLPFADGFLVGFDKGEWGGALFWFAGNGSRHQKLGDKNVRGLVSLDGNAALAIEGLSHLSISEGGIRWIKSDQGVVKATKVTKLPDAPDIHLVTDDGLYMLTTSSLVRLARDDQFIVVQPVLTSGLYPDSMVIDGRGTMWIGMRHFVLRLTPVNDQFSETWLVSTDCARAEIVGYKCVCRGR